MSFNNGLTLEHTVNVDNLDQYILTRGNAPCSAETVDQKSSQEPSFALNADQRQVLQNQATQLQVLYPAQQHRHPLLPL